MAFLVRPVRHEDLDVIYSDKRSVGIEKFTYRRRQECEELMQGPLGVFAPSRAAVLIFLPAVRDIPGFHYLFCVDDGFAVLRFERYSTFSFVHVSDELRNRLGEVKELIRAAFKVGGQFVDGTQDINDADAVPDAQLV